MYIGHLPVESKAQLHVARWYVPWRVALDGAAPRGEGRGHSGAIEAVVLELAGVGKAAEVTRDEVAGGAVAHGAEVG